MAILLLVSTLFRLHDTRVPPLTLLCFFAAWGVMGEMIFSLLWDTLFIRRLWIYQVGTAFHAYTSVLNFAPWAVGGALYLTIAELLNRTPTTSSLISFWIVLAGTYGTLLIGRIVVAHIHHFKTIEFKHFTPYTYAWFILPVVLALMSTHSVEVWILAMVFGFVGWGAEYAFGKLCHQVLGKRLWVYTYGARDKGHITPYAIVPFALAGMWFYSGSLLLISLF